MTDEHAVTIVGTEVLSATQAKDHAELTMATAVARAKVAGKMIKDANLFKRINGKNYVFVDGWTTLAAMYNLSVSIVWTKREEDGTVRARAELVNMKTGVTLGVAAESECGGEGDDTWIGRTAMAKGSMAQTRATSKVCRLALSWIMVLGGYAGTPAEEMNGDPDSEAPKGRAKGSTIAQIRIDAQDLIQAALKDKRMTYPQMGEWLNGLVAGSFEQRGDKWFIIRGKFSKADAQTIIAALAPRPADEPTKPIGGEVEQKPADAPQAAQESEPPPASGSQVELPSTAHECPNCHKAVPGLPEGATCNDCIGLTDRPAEGSE